MGLGRNPNDPDLTIVTVVLRYGAFPSVFNGIQCARMSVWNNRRSDLVNFNIQDFVKSLFFLYLRISDTLDNITLSWIRWRIDNHGNYTKST